MNNSQRTSFVSSLHRSAFEIALLYLLVGGLWILFSDRLAAEIAPNLAALTMISIYKGWVYVIVTALMLYWLMRRDSIKHANAEEALRASEEKYRYLFDNNPHPMWAYDLKTLEFLAVNAAAIDKYGYTRAEFLQMTIADIRPSEDVDRLKKHLELPRPSLQHSGEWRHKLKDGTLIDVDISSHTLKLSGRETALVVAQDITERRRAEVTVRASEERFRAMIENGLDDISLLDVNGNLLWESPAVVRNLGYPENAFVGRNIFAIVHPEDKAWTSALYARLSEVPGSRKEGKFRLQRSDGTWRWVEAIVTNMLDNPSVQAIVVNYRDITERKLAEENYQSIFERSAEGIFQSSPDGRFINVNPAMAHIYGYASPQEMLEAIEDIPRQIYLEPQDRAEFTSLINTENSVLNFEMKNKRKDGSIIWTSTTARAILAVDGKLLYYEGFLQDITERKEMEAALHASETRYHGIFDGVQDAIFVEDLEGNILDVNRRACEIYGYTHAEFITKKLTDIVPSEAYIVRLWDDKDVSLERSYETLNVRANGECFPVEIRGGFYESDGRKLFLVVLRDITERKQAEEKLHASEERYRQLVDNFPNGTVTIYNRDLQLTFVAGSDLKKLNAQPQDFLEKKFQELAPPETFAIAEPFLRAAFQGRGGAYETPYWDDRYYYVNVAPIHKSNGEIDEILVISQNISERKHAEEALRESEALYRQAIEVAGAVPYYESYYNEGKSIKYEFIGEGIRQITGYGPDEFNAQVWDSLVEEVNLVDDLAGYSLDEGIQRVRSGETSIWKCEHRIRDRAGNIHWVFESAVEMRDEQGVSHGSIGTYQDITARKQAESALRESEQRFRALFEASPVAIWEEDFSEVKKYLDSLKQQGSIDPRAYFASHPDEIARCSLLIKVMNVNDTAVKMFQAESKAQLIESTTQSVSTGELEHNLEDFIAIAEGRTSNSWEGSDQTLTDKPVEINLSWSVVPGHESNYSRVILTTTDITERKQAEEALRESEERFHSLFDRMLDGVYRSTHTGKFVDVNPALVKMFGYSNQEEILKVNIKNELYFAPEERGSHVLDTGNEETDIYRMRRKDGSEIWVEDHGSYVHDEEGNIIYHEGILRDVTERKLADEALRLAEEKYRDLVERLPLVVYTSELGISGVWSYVSPQIEALLGFTPQEWMADPNIWYHQVHPEDRDLQELLEEKANATGKPFETEYRIFTKDEREIWIRDSGHILNLEAGKAPIVQGVLVDITERKQVEAQLRKLSRAVEQSASTIVITDKAGNIEYVNPKFTEITGYTIEEARSQTPRILKSGHTSQKEYEHLWQSITAGQEWRGEFLNRKKNDDLYWESATISPILNERGEVTHFVAVKENITERKQYEQELRESHVRFQQLVDNIQEVFWITDALNGEEIYISPAAERIWGRSIENLMQAPRAFLEHIHPADHPAVLRALEEQRNGQRTEVEYRVVQVDGSVRWILDRAFPIFDEAGVVVRLTGIAADITERKQAEAGTRRHLAELEALYENGLAVGRLLEAKEIGERIIETFARHLSWHHVAIRLKNPESDGLELIAFNQPDLSADEKAGIERRFNSMISRVGQGVSGWVVSRGEPVRVGNVHLHPHYVDTHPGIQSGLYMPLKVGEHIIGVISVESEMPDAFSEQDERLLATLANQAAIAFENARLYQSAQQELLERKRIEMELRTSETHYRELADSITDIFFELDQNLHYSHWNKASELLTGVSADEAIGKSMRDILGESEEQTRIEKIYRGVLENHNPRTFETLFMVNNEPRSFEVNAYPSTNGVSVVAKDVTERKRSETIMQKRFELMEFAARHLLEEIMQMTTDEVCHLTGSAFGFFHILEADQATLGLQIWSTNTLSLFNVPISEGRHQAVEQAGVWAEAVHQRRAVIHNDYESLSNKRTLPLGHAPLMREMVIPIIRNEKILAVMGVANKPEEYTLQDLEIAERFVDYAWDITERKQMALALAEERNQLAKRVEERTIDLSRANANLARALRVKDEFLANMSHELRTPLNAILGLSESLAEKTAGPLNEKQQRYITTVSESGRHLLSLINDILDLAKIEAGQITLDVNKVDIQSVCDASMRMIKQLAQKKNQDTVVEVNGKLGLMWADERRLKQMLVNLLSNAVKFTPENGKLGLEVHGDQEANKVTFTVWDTGIGIQETDLPRIFQPFVQLDAGLARESSGTGLGLALVVQMARMHGGSASVVSEPGKGSRFSIMLPWEPALAVDTVERLKITGKFRPVKFNQNHKPTILLIEDTEEVIMVLSDYLELNGFKIITARDGLEGVTQAQLTHPDLILMDIQMPRMDGFEATKRLRSEPEFKATPIIALTALAMPNDRERCLAAGMDEYITKPVHLRALVKIIELFLSGGKVVKSL